MFDKRIGCFAMDHHLDADKIMWRFFSVILSAFFFVSVFWVIKYWEYMPYVDESVTVSAVQNMITEGLPRVGATRDSVMFDLPPEPQYYWTYIVEIWMRVPLEIVGTWLELDNIQPLTNLCFTVFSLLFLYYFLKNWIWNSKSKEKILYLQIVTSVLVVVICSEGFMSFVHYVRYYHFAMMSFLLSIFTIPVYIENLARGGVGLRSGFKIIFMGILPCMFHLSFIPYCFITLLILMKEMRRGKLLERKMFLIAMPSIIFISVGSIYILSSRKTDLFGMIHIKTGNFIQYITNVISLDIAEIIIAVIVLLIHFMSYTRQPDIIKKLIQLVGINLAIYMFVVGSGTYTSARYCWSLRISYIVLTVIAVSVIVDRLCRWKQKSQASGFMIAFLCVFIWGVFSKGNFKGYTMLPLVSWKEFYLMEDSLKAVNAAQAVVFSDCSLPVSLKHPQWYAYLFRNYSEIEEAGLTRFNGSINYYKNNKEDYFTVSNQAFAGKKKDIDRILAKFKNIEDEVFLVFWKCNLERTDMDIQNFFADTGINLSKPIHLIEFKNIWEDYFEN